MAKNNNARINFVYEFFCAKPGYLKKSLDIVSELTGEENIEIIRLARELYRNTFKSTTNRLEPYLDGNPDNVLVIGDPHEPFTLEGYMAFCRSVQEEYDCGTVVHIGDAVDNHAVSYHEKDPEGMSAGDEFNLALLKMKEWYYTFPNVKVCIGNHDALPFRKAFTAGLPKTWLKTYQELLQSPPTWQWDFTHEINGVIYQHGNVRYLASYKDLIFGVSVGCGIDHEKYAFAYGKQNTRKPVVACAVILNGKLPINIPMSL